MTNNEENPCKCIDCKKIHLLKDLKVVASYQPLGTFTLLHKCPWCGSGQLIDLIKKELL